MTISYDKLWKLLIDKKMNRTDLKNAAGVSFNVLALTCDIGDVMEFIENEPT